MLKPKRPLEIVAELSGSTALDVDTNQANRYCIKLHTVSGREAYYFATPIYNAHSRKIVQRNFVGSNGCYQFVGSNCEVIVTPTQIKLTRGKQYLAINLGKTYSWGVHDGVLVSNQLSITPTYNGVCIEGPLIHMSFDTVVSFGHQNIRTSQNCVCFMESRFKPIVVMSALFSAKQKVGCHPLRIRYRETTPKEGNLSFLSEDPLYNYGICEINFYEPKLIQDTPVSGKHPKENNAFGPIAFIGKSTFYGTQWLYTRLDVNKLPDLQHKYIREIKLYIPRFTNTSVALDTFELSNRFCSFGSTWSNKIAKEDRHDAVKINGEYACVDLTRHYTNRGLLTEAAGVVITPARASELGYQAISTGDSYIMPPILCIKYANI